MSASSHWHPDEIDVGGRGVAPGAAPIEDRGARLVLAQPLVALVTGTELGEDVVVRYLRPARDQFSTMPAPD